MRTELVTTPTRQATELLFDLERDKEPILITQHGLHSAYLVHVESYELLQRPGRNCRRYRYRESGHACTSSERGRDR